MPVDGGGTATLPDGIQLTRAIFHAEGGDLVIVTEDGREFRVDGYFETTPRPDIATPAGSHLGADIVEALLVAAPAHPAAAFSDIEHALGHVATLAGEAAVVHPDGSREPLAAGALLHKGDVLETAPDSALGLAFPDGSGLSLGPGGRLIMEELFVTEDGGGAARLFVQRGAFAVTPGSLADGAGDAFIVRTPTASLAVHGAAVGGTVESDGGTVATLLDRADGHAAGEIIIRTQAGQVLLDHPGSAVTAEDLMLQPSQPFHFGFRDADGFLGEVLALVPGGATIFGADRVERLTEALDHPPVHAAAMVPDVATAQAALHDATAAEQAARSAAAEAHAQAEHAAADLQAAQAHAEQVLHQGDTSDAAFQAAVAARTAAEQHATDAAQAVAQSDVVEAQVADKLAAAEEAVRQAQAAAETARAEALRVMQEAEARDQAFQDAQAQLAEARQHEQQAAEVAALHDDAEHQAAQDLAAARAAAETALQQEQTAQQQAAERATTADVVETAAAEAGIHNDPFVGDPANPADGWTSSAVAEVDIGARALAAGEEAARHAFNAALADGQSAAAALEAAIQAADRAGGQESAEATMHAGAAGLADHGTEIASFDTAGGSDPGMAGSDGGFAGSSGDGTIAGSSSGDGSSFSGGFTSGRGDGAGSAGGDVLIGGEGGDAAAAGFGGVDGLDGGFAYGFRFEAPSLVFVSHVETDAERRDDPQTHDISAASTTSSSVADILTGTAGADLLAGDDGASTLSGLGGDDVLYGDTPTNLLAGTHTAASPLLHPTFSSGGADQIDGGAGDDLIWGGAGADVLSGGDGNDTFHLGDDDHANDTVWGGHAGADAGTDTVSYADAGAGVHVDLAAGTASGTTVGTDHLSGIENATGTAHADDLFGDANANRLEGLGGNDLIKGLAGDDNLFGFAGDDVLIGGHGSDVLNGGDGADAFGFEGGSGATVADRVASLGVDTIQDFNAADGDTLQLSNADFGLGDSGNLTDGATYLEIAAALSSTPTDVSGGSTSGPAVLVIGAASGQGGVDVYYTEDASHASTDNSYQVAHLDGVDTSTISAGDVTLKS